MDLIFIGVVAMSPTAFFREFSYINIGFMSVMFIIFLFVKSKQHSWKRKMYAKKRNLDLE